MLNFDFFSAENQVGTVFAYILVVLVKVENFYGEVLVKSVIGVILKQAVRNHASTITDDRIFIEKLATFFEKANAASRAVPVC